MVLPIILKSILILVVAYLLGSVSWAYVIGRYVSGIDMTEVGNGRIGTAFAIRRLGFAWGITVGVLDFLKGAVAVVIPLIMEMPFLSILLSAMAVVAGHNWSIFLGFKGGRGAATSFGVLAILTLLPVVITTAVMAYPFLATRKSEFLGGVRRTTLLYGIFLAVISAIIWLNTVFSFFPALPWSSESSLWLVALPPVLMLLNLAGRPQARKGFDNQTPLG
jgi:acyl phosphate:glycerol-3-phosphate acyltransferase